MAGTTEMQSMDMARRELSRGNKRPVPRVHNVGHGSPITVSADGQYSIEFVECLASCGSAPVAMVDDLFHENINPRSGAAALLKLDRSDATTPRVRAPHPREHRLVFKNIDREGWRNDLATYQADGGYEDLKKAFTMKPEVIVDEVKKSGLRGRGGAGFPCGVKWGFIKRGGPKPTYLICNADESEPGTFKDRYIIHQDPHQLLEGMIISCFAVGASLAYIYIRGEFPEGAQILEKALAEARQAGFLGRNILGSGFDLEIYVHRGAGAYICGEETGLIESLEGKRAYPRIKPPYFPAVLGLYQCPTIVNNVETLCDVKHIVRLSGEGFAKLGRPNNTGTRILCVSGDVQRPGYYEVEVGSVTLGELIHDLCGGLKPGRQLKAVIPGGSSAKVLRAGEKYKIKDREVALEDVPMDFDTLAAAGSMAGSGGVIVMDDSRDMVAMLNNINEFYAHESCGQCTPCREGSLWMKKITDRILAGGGTSRDPDLLKNVADNIAGKTICAFGEACAWPVQSFVAKFKRGIHRPIDQSHCRRRCRPSTTRRSWLRIKPFPRSPRRAGMVEKSWRRRRRGSTYLYEIPSLNRTGRRRGVRRRSAGASGLYLRWSDARRGAHQHQGSYRWLS